MNESEFNRLKKRIEKIELQLETISKWFRSDLSDRPKTKLVNAIIDQKKFPSKKSWMRIARVCPDTFYGLESKIRNELEKKGYRVVYRKMAENRIAVELKDTDIL